MTIKTKYIVLGILLSLIGILIGSLTHLAATFYAVETPGKLPWVVSLVLAIAFEAGMLTTCFSMAERRRQKKSTNDLLLYLIAFGVANVYFNVDYSLTVMIGIPNFKWVDITNNARVDWYTLIRVGMTSGSLQLFVIALSEQFSIFLLKLRAEEQEAKIAAMTPEEIEAKTILKKRVSRAIKKDSIPDEQVEDHLLGLAPKPSKKARKTQGTRNKSSPIEVSMGDGKQFWDGPDVPKAQ